jgi:hypothetical protein
MCEPFLSMDCRVKPGNDEIVSFASHLTHSPAATEEQHPVFSRRAAPEFCCKKNEKLRARSRRMAAGGGTGSISIAPGS